jgi:hypothetical protein
MSGATGGEECREGEIAAPMHVQQMDTLVRFRITSAREGDRQRRALSAISAPAPALGARPSSR